jgi:hypothetical protein
LSVLDQRLGGGPTEPSPAAACQLLRGAGIRACCFEDSTLVRASAPARYGTVRELLTAVVAANPGYRWDVTPDGLVDVFPSPSVLDETVSPIKVADTGLWRVLEEDLSLRRYGIELFMELRDGDGPPVSVDLPGGSLRAALDTLVAPITDSVWHVSGLPGAYFLTVSRIG